MGIRGIRCISSPTWLSTLEGVPWVTLTPGAPACMDHKGDREDRDWSQGFLVTEEFKMASFWHMFASFWHVACFWCILHTNLSERKCSCRNHLILRKSMMIKNPWDNWSWFPSKKPCLFLWRFIFGESMDHKEDEEIILEKNGIKGSG